MTSEPEHALLIPRVSSGNQDEENQVPELQAYADRREYVVDHTELIHGKSAFHGRHMAKILAAVDKHVRHGRAVVVVFRHVDRMSRLHWEDGMRFFLKIRDAGARVEFAKQEFLNDNMELIGLFLKLAYEESKIKSDRQLQGNAAMMRDGIAYGKPPWGYEFGEVAGKRILVPTVLGRLWVPRIYQAAVDGKSLRAIAEMLTAAGVPSPQKNSLWGKTTIARLIENPAYHGGRTGKGNMTYEALVGAELWQQAQMALTSRQRSGRNPVKRVPALLVPLCGACYGTVRTGAPSGKSPMRVSGKPTGPAPLGYYLCTGHGPQHRSCGLPNTGIPVDQLDAIIEEMMSSGERPHYEAVYVPGDDKAARLAEIDEKIAAAARTGRRSEIPALMDEAAEIEAQPVRKARYEQRTTGITVGEHWQSLTRDEKREELARYEITASKDEDGHVYATITPKGFITEKAEELTRNEVSGRLPHSDLWDRLVQETKLPLEHA